MPAEIDKVGGLQEKTRSWEDAAEKEPRHVEDGDTSVGSSSYTESGLLLPENAQSEGTQPSPVPSVPHVSPYIIIPIWISLSGGLILFNKWILTSRGFSFPVFLTTYHMLVAMIGTNILRHTTDLLASAETPLPRRIWTHAILPIAFLYAFSLVLSNAAYVRLSVSFVQMIKAFIPVLLHLISCAVGLARMDKVTATILLTVSVGCVIASMGELRYNYLGLACQLGATVAEASRLVVVQVLLRDIKMNPLVSLYYFAPVCLLFLAMALPFLEGIAPFYAIFDLGWHILLANGLMAFALNVASVVLISASGSLVSTLSGVLKDILLISISVPLLGSVVSGQQIFGYGITLVGLISFKDRDRIITWLNNVQSQSAANANSDLSSTEYVHDSQERGAVQGSAWGLGLGLPRLISPLGSLNRSAHELNSATTKGVPSATGSGIYEGFAAFRGALPALFSPKIGSEDDGPIGILPKWTSRRASEAQISGVRGEWESKWRRANRRKHTQPIRILLYLLILLGLAWLIILLSELRPGAVQSLKTSLGLQPPVAAHVDATVSGVTLVSGFFYLEGSQKHDFGDYYQWFQNLLNNTEHPIVFFTSPDLVDLILEFRQEKPIHVISDYETAWEMPPLEQLGGATWGEIMHKIDPLQPQHVAGHYGVWTAKPWMVKHAKDINPFNSEYFFWVDAGGFRDSRVRHHMRALPERLEEIYATVPNDTIVLGFVGNENVEWPEGTDYVKAATWTSEVDRRNSHMQGAWCGGPADAVEWWAAETLRVTQIQAGLQRFSGNEQDIWTHTARLFWNKVYVQNYYFNNGQCGDVNVSENLGPWFAYGYWSDSWDCQVPAWNGPEIWRAEQEQAAAAAAAIASAALVEI